MKFQTMMIIKAIVCLTLGVPILLAPIFFYSLFGAPLNPGGVFAARQYGAFLIGNLLLTWFARNVIESESRRAIAMALCVYDAIGFYVTLMALLSGAVGPLGWFAAALYLFFAVAFGIFLLPQKEGV